MTMDEFIMKFTSLLRYVPYLCDEKAKVHHFLSSLLIHMKERIEFINPKTMDEAIRKERMCYQLSKAKGEIGKSGPPRKGQNFFTNNRNNRSGNYKNAARNPLSKRNGKIQTKTKWASEE